MKKAMTLILLAALLLQTVACGSQQQISSDTDPYSPDTTTTSGENEEISRENTPDSLPDNLDFGGITLNILFPESHGGSADQIDFVEEDDGDVVNAAVYNRQRSVEERLNVTFELHKSYGVNEYASKLKNLVYSGDTTFDLVYGSQNEALPLTSENVFLDLSDAQYIDYSQPWWNLSYMDEITVYGKHYLLGGDISLSMLSYMSCMYVNKQQFEEISGESMDDLYQLVLDGDWTMDALAEYCQKSYRDLNGNSTIDENDQFGMGAVTASTTDHMTFDSGIKFTTRNANDEPEFAFITEKTIDYAEKLYRLFYENEGVSIYPPEQSYLRITIPNKLMANEMTFMCGYFYSASLLREMETDYGIIPYPKLDETIDGYRSLVHNSAMIVGVPMTCEHVEAVCAAIEALGAEGYRTVTPAYYEVALKTKYIRDDISGQIVDLIHDAGTTEFAYAYNASLGGVGVIMRTLMTNKTSDLTSTWAKSSSVATKKLEELVEHFKNAD